MDGMTINHIVSIDHGSSDCGTVDERHPLLPVLLDETSRHACSCRPKRRQSVRGSQRRLVLLEVVNGGPKTDTLWLFNIAMGNGPFIDGLPIKNCDFPWLC